MRYGVVGWLVVISVGCTGYSNHEDAACLVPAEEATSCGDSSADTAVLLVLAGESPFVGVDVYTHRTTGEIIGTARTDARGCVALPSEPHALVSIVAEPGLVTSSVRSTGQLLVRLRGETNACTAGTATIDSATTPPGGATGFTFELGCTTRSVDEIPASVEVPSECLGTDDMLVVTGHAYAIANGPNGIPTSTVLATYVGAGNMHDGHVQVVGSWTIAREELPIVVDTSMVPDASAIAVPQIDGLTYEYVTSMPFDGIEVLGSIPHDQGAGYMLRRIIAPPPTVVIDANDFLAPITEPLTTKQRAPLAFGWSSAIAADVLVAETSFDVNGSPMRWIAVVPATTTELAIPQLPPGTILLPDPADLSHPVSVQRWYVDGDDIASFDAVLAQGLHLDRTGLDVTRPLPRSSSARTVFHADAF